MATFSDVYTTAYGDQYGSRSLTDTYRATYGTGYGTPFPAAPLDVKLALSLAGAWEDITGYAYQRDTNAAITVSRGRPDESSNCNPGQFGAQFNNRDGRFVIRNPSGAWYGSLNRNTPLRCSVPGLEPYLRIEDDAQSGATCPDANPLDITGGIDIRLDIRPSSYQPCVLASKWLGLVNVPQTTPPPTPGASIFKADVANASSQLGAGQTFDGWLGGHRTPAMNAQRIYHNPGDLSGASGDDLALLANKVQLVISWKPATNGSDWATLSPSIGTYVTAAAAAGAPPPIVTFWHEPSNAKNNLTATQFKAMMQTYYPLVKAAYPTVQVIYIALGTGAGVVANYYPGDAFCDGIYQDIYANMWRNGQGSNMDAAVALASAARPPKPVGNGEVGYSAGKSQPTTSEFAAFMAYIGSVYVAQAQAGLPCGCCMLWDGFSTGSNGNITGPSDPRLPAIQSWYDTLASASGSGGGTTTAQRSWALVLNGDGTLGLWWTSDGTLATVQKVNSTVPVPLGRVTVRAFAQISHGTATVTFYTAPGGNADNTGTTAPWTQLGQPITGLTLNIWSSTAPLAVGWNSALAADYPAYGGLTGAVYDLELRSFTGQYADTYTDVYGAAYAGLTVAQASFAGQAEGATSWTDPYGNPWSVTGTAEISKRSYRFHGEMSSLPTSWDVTGTDVWSPVQAGGLLRRLSQGTQPPVSSAFKRFVLGLAGNFTPEAYWPCEDASTATQIGPAIGPAPIVFGVPPTMSSDSGFQCSAALPVVGGAVMRGSVQPYTGGTAAIFRFLLHYDPTAGAITDDTVLARATTTGTVADFTLKYKTSGHLRLTGYTNASGGSYLFDTGALSQFDVDGELLLVSMELTGAGGGTIKYAISTLAVGSSVPTTVSGTATGVPGNIALAGFNNDGEALPGVGVGHAFVQSAYEPLTDFASALNAWAGETCAQRFARLCGENGAQARIYGYPGTDVPMGAQAPDTFVNLLQLCEDTGRGLIYEPRQCLGLGYRTVGSLTQQSPAVVADYSLAHVGEDSSTLLAPVTDDQHSINDVTVTSGSGTSYELTLNDGSAMSISPPPAGIGDYGNSYTVNTSSDAQLSDIGGWILGIGTNAEDRYPAIPWNLARAEVANLFWDLQDANDGDHFQIVNTPGFLAPPPVKQLLYGVSETFGGFRQSMAWNAVPEAPYEVGILDDPVYGHADTDGSELDSPAPAGPVADGYGDVYTDRYGAAVAGLYVDTVGPSGVLWTTDPDDFPFDILVGGEQMTVLAISGASSPQLFSVVTGVNGITKAHQGGEAVDLAHPMIIGLAS